MKSITLHRQTQLSEVIGMFSLPVQESVASPYFRMGRDNRITERTMIKAFILGYSPMGVGTGLYVGVVTKDTVGSNNYSLSVPMSISSSDTEATIRANAPGVVSTFFTTNGITLDSIEWVDVPVAVQGLSNAPQAAIADAPADAVTNYNTITTLLGGLTGAVNTANSKQNDIATRLNSLLAELRTLGLIAT